MTTPLDPTSERGQAVAERLTRTLADISLSIADRKRREQQRQPASQQQAA